MHREERMATSSDIHIHITILEEIVEAGLHWTEPGLSLLRTVKGISSDRDQCRILPDNLRVYNLRQKRKLQHKIYP